MSSKSRSQVSRPKSRNARHGDHQKVVGSYLIGKTVGEGTFGKVKLAVHIPTGEKVAVKILEKNRIKDQADVRRVNREIKILKKAKNSNIIQLYEVIDTSSAIYLMMENADGGELFDYIVQHRHVAEIQACKFFHQLIDGVDALHRYEITHRDLKPENLLLKNSPNGLIVKIVDFGLSNTHEGGKFLSTACGSPCYAAPEMIAGHKYFGPLADIWSIGVILFALVCGYLPFEDPNTSALYKKILSGEYKPAKWISSEVKDLIRKILEVDPKKRFTMELIKGHPWYNMVSEAAIPRDMAHESSSNAEFRRETLVSVEQAGFDSQAVSDAVSSNCCNSLSALYYLFEQKLYVSRIRPSEGENDFDNKIVAPNSNNLNNTHSAHPADTCGPLESAVPSVVPVLQPLQPPPVNLRPVVVSNSPAVLDWRAPDKSIVNTNIGVVIEPPQSVPSILPVKPPASTRVVADRHNWRLRGYRAQPEKNSKLEIDPLSVVSTRAVLQNKDMINGAGVPSPKHRPVPPAIKAAPASPRKNYAAAALPVLAGQSEINTEAAVITASGGVDLTSKITGSSQNGESVEHSSSNKENAIFANPPPDELEAISERPSTRRSHLRTPGRNTRPNTAEYGEFGEATVQPDELVFREKLCAPPSYDVPGDLNTSVDAIPEDESPPAAVTNRAPEEPKSSNPHGVGGRRGRHIKPKAEVSDKGDDFSDGSAAEEVRGASSVPRTTVINGKQPVNIIASIGARLLAPMATGKSDQNHVSARDAAARNKASQKGTLISSAGGIVVSGQ